MQLPMSFRPSRRIRHHLLLLAAVTITGLLAACQHTVKPARQTLGIFPVVDGALARRITHAGTVPEGYRIMHEPDGTPVVIVTTPIIEDRVISSATASIANNSGEPAITITLTQEGAEKMRAYTADHVGDRLATVWRRATPGASGDYQWELIQAPTIQGVFGKHFMTTGLDSIGEARQLAAALNKQEEH